MVSYSKPTPKKKKNPKQESSSVTLMHKKGKQFCMLRSEMVKQTIVKQNTAEQISNSRFKGVRKRKWGKYVSEIRLPNSRERIWLGSYDTAEKAARAFDAALFCLRGGSAKFNFPDNLPDIAGGRSLTPGEIQVAAARFANSEPQPQVSHSDQSVCGLRVDSPCPSGSDGTVQLDSDLRLDGSFLDLLTTGSGSGSGNFASDYVLFPGFDDFSTEYFAPSIPSVDIREENFDGVVTEEPFLWNF